VTLLCLPFSSTYCAIWIGCRYDGTALPANLTAAMNACNADTVGRAVSSESFTCCCRGAANPPCLHLPYETLNQTRCHAVLRHNQKPKEFNGCVSPLCVTVSTAVGRTHTRMHGGSTQACCFPE
jgi:hypothetical protein